MIQLLLTPQNAVQGWLQFCGAGCPGLCCWLHCRGLHGCGDTYSQHQGWRYPHSPFLILVPSSESKFCLHWSLAGPGRPYSLYGLNPREKWMQHGNPTSWAESEQMPAGGVSSWPTLEALVWTSLLLKGGGLARTWWSWVLRCPLQLKAPERRGETRE